MTPACAPPPPSRRASSVCAVLRVWDRRGAVGCRAAKRRYKERGGSTERALRAAFTFVGGAALDVTRLPLGAFDEFELREGFNIFLLMRQLADCDEGGEVEARLAAVNAGSAAMQVRAQMAWGAHPQCARGNGGVRCPPMTRAAAAAPARRRRRTTARRRRSSRRTRVASRSSGVVRGAVM